MCTHPTYCLMLSVQCYVYLHICKRTVACPEWIMFQGNTLEELVIHFCYLHKGSLVCLFVCVSSLPSPIMDKLSCFSFCEVLLALAWTNWFLGFTAQRSRSRKNQNKFLFVNSEGTFKQSDPKNSINLLLSYTTYCSSCVKIWSWNANRLSIIKAIFIRET